jgi:predicted Zn-dependent protease
VVDVPGLETTAITGLARALVAAGRPKDAAARLESYLLDVDPYDGRAALELARVSKGLGDSKDRCIELASRALRFGAGEAALAMLHELDPTQFKEAKPARS